jgi:parallel beta-helix repeat protein
VKIDSSSDVTVRNSRLHDGRTFGIVVVRSSNIVLERNEIYGNADGIEERYASNLVIRANRIRSNLKEVDAGPSQEGINSYKSTGRMVVEWNSLWNDGTHFEVYGASNLVIRHNSLRDGQVMETGTTGGLACARNVFVRNVAYRGSRISSGLILRCAEDMLVAHNVLDGFDQFAFDVVDGLKGVPYGGSIASSTTSSFAGAPTASTTCFRRRS